MPSSKRSSTFNEHAKSPETTDEKITDQIHSMGLEQGELKETPQEEEEYERLYPAPRMKGWLGNTVRQSYFEENQEQLWQANKQVKELSAQEAEARYNAERDPMDVETYRDEVLEREQQEERQEQTFEDYAANEWESFNQKFDERGADIALLQGISEEEREEALKELEIEREQAGHDLSDRLHFEEHGNIDHDLDESFDIASYQADHSV